MTHSRRRSLVLLAVVVVGGSALATPARGQSGGPSGEFSYSPSAQQRGQSVQITGKCVNGGSTEENMIVTVRQGPDGQGDFGFSKVFPAAANGGISGTIEVPGDAPFGDYVIGGACRSANTAPYFSKNGPFAVVERGSDVTTATTAAPPTATTTTVAGATTTTSTTTGSTTSTTVAETTTTTQALEVFQIPDDDEDATTTTIDEFAGTRNDDESSIGPLLLLFGAIPLILATIAIGLAMRRRNAPS